jgi:bla regulator protein BlaR1
MRRLSSVLVAAVALLAHAQSSETFDVAAIKPSDPATYGYVSVNTSHGNYNASGITVKNLVGDAYEVHSFQIEGLPKWAESDRFDIKAKSDDDPAPIDLTHIDESKLQQLEAQHQRLKARLQALLADRFALKFHRITKDLPVYVLTQSKSGAKLSAAKTPGDLANSGVHINNGDLTATNLTMRDFANTLTGQTDRVVIDKTGLSARYDFAMIYVRDDERTGQNAGSAPEGPSLFTALQEQLGLKLSPEKAPIEVLVIDSVQKPSAN